MWWMGFWALLLRMFYGKCLVTFHQCMDQSCPCATLVSLRIDPGWASGHLIGWELTVRVAARAIVRGERESGTAESKCFIIVLPDLTILGRLEFNSKTWVGRQGVDSWVQRCGIWPHSLCRAFSLRENRKGVKIIFETIDVWWKCI